MTTLNDAAAEAALVAHMWDASDDSLCSCGWSPDNYFASDAEADRKYVRDDLINAEEGDGPDLWAPVVAEFVAHQREFVITAALPHLRKDWETPDDDALDALVDLIQNAARGGCGSHHGCRELVRTHQRNAARRWFIDQKSDCSGPTP